jgi:hypothetical protein
LWSLVVTIDFLRNSQNSLQETAQYQISHSSITNQHSPKNVKNRLKNSHLFIFLQRCFP